MPSRDQLMAALRRADAAGDTAAAQAIARRLQGAGYETLSHRQASNAYQAGLQKVNNRTQGMTNAQKAKAIERYQNDPSIQALKKRMNDTSGVSGLSLGALKPVDTLATWASNIPVLGPAMDKAGAMLGMPTAQQAVNSNRAGRASNTHKGWQAVGEILGTLPTMALPGGAVAQGAATGALLSDNPTDVPALAKDAVVGGVLGKAGELAGKGVSRVIAGKSVPKNVRLLADEGVVMTPGQRGGRFANFVEDQVLGSVPLLRDIPAAARARGANDLRVAAANRVLAPIGGKVERGTQFGNEAIAGLQDVVGQAYDDAIQGLTLKIDPRLAQGLDDIVAGANREVGTEGANQLSAYAAHLKDRLADGLSGDALKQELQSLRGVASETGKNNPLLGSRLWNMHNVIDNALGVQSGAAAPAYRNARESMTLLRRVEDAAARPGVVNGEFGPTHLLQAAKRRGFGTTTSNVASGEARMLDLANAAADVMRNTTANSGTVPRALAAGSILGGGSGALAAADLVTPGTSAMLLGSLAPYIPGADRAIQKLMLDRPEVMRTAGEAASRYAPALGAPGTAGTLGLIDLISQ